MSRERLPNRRRSDRPLGTWRNADDDKRFQILSIVNAAIVSLRERHKLPPFEDPLPGAPLNAFLVIRELLR